MDGSDNAQGAENQQERLEYHGWIVGFVDGEGCFSCPIFRNRTTSLGWQIQPTFKVVQGASSRDVLEELKRFFECGRVYANKRQDNHKEDLVVYNVSRLRDLIEVIIPFFQAHPLRTAKRENFDKFAYIVDQVAQKAHLTAFGMAEIATIAETMNSAEAISVPENPQRPYADQLAIPGELKRWSDPRGDAGRLAETTNPPGALCVGFTSNKTSEIPCRVIELPGAEVIPCKYPLITAEPYPMVSTKDEAIIGG